MGEGSGQASDPLTQSLRASSADLRRRLRRGFHVGGTGTWQSVELSECVCRLQETRVVRGFISVCDITVLSFNRAASSVGRRYTSYLGLSFYQPVSTCSVHGFIRTSFGGREKGLPLVSPKLRKFLWQTYAIQTRTGYCM